MKLHPQFITDKNGKVKSVILPIKEFRELIELYGIDLSREEIESIEKNKKLREKGSSMIENEYIDLNEL